VPSFTEALFIDALLSRLRSTFTESGAGEGVMIGQRARSASFKLIVVFMSLVIAQAAPQEKLDDTIAYLLNYVANSKATFIRNGTSHTPDEAVAHIKAKYEHFKPQIKTPEDFIRLCASQSLQSGKPYLVRPVTGQEMPLNVWLTAELQAHRANSKG